MSDEVTTETISLTQHWLGARPYTLIELDEASNGSGEPAVFVTAGGMAEEEPLYLPLMAVSGGQAEGNPVAEMLRRLYPQETDGYYRQAIAAVVREFNPDWLPFVTGDET